MPPLAAFPMHYYPATDTMILPPGATQSCHLNGSGLDCQIRRSAIVWRLWSEQQASNVWFADHPPRTFHSIRVLPFGFVTLYSSSGCTNLSTNSLFLGPQPA